MGNECVASAAAASGVAGSEVHPGTDGAPRSAAWPVAERCVRVAVKGDLERGVHVVSFVGHDDPPGRRYLYVSKSGDFASRTDQDFHWVSNFAAFDALEPTVASVSIENGPWSFASGDACVSYGVLAPDQEEPQLPEWAPEYECVTFSLRPAAPDEADSVVFMPEREQLPAELHDAYRRYYVAYSDVDGHALSIAEQEEMANPPLGLTYGESHFAPMYQLLRQLGIQSGDVVVDLGSGTGRVVIAAALAFPELRRCLGVEFLPGLHAAALRAEERLGHHGPGRCAPLEFVQGDFLEEDWSDASVVFMMSLCFPQELTAELERRALDLRPGSRLVTMHCYFGEASGGALRPLPIRAAEPRHGVYMEMSFGFATLYVFERVDVACGLCRLDDLD